MCYALAMNEECTPNTCPCKAHTADDATRLAAKLIGLDADRAHALMSMLNAHGWRLEK